MSIAPRNCSFFFRKLLHCSAFSIVSTMIKIERLSNSLNLSFAAMIASLIRNSSSSIEKFCSIEKDRAGSDYSPPYQAMLLISLANAR